VLDEIRDIVEEQAPGERNQLFREGVLWAVAHVVKTGAGTWGVPCENDHQRRVVEMVAAVMRRGK
jgi:hypothetical protein